MELPKRKNNRLQNFDYSQAGVYFITICTQNNKKIFWKACGNGTHPVGAIHESPVFADGSLLSEYGKSAEKTIGELPGRFNITVNGYVIMPNHIHILIEINSGVQVRAIRESPLQGRSELSKIVGYLKMNVSKSIHSAGYDKEIWQRSFYDHIIRNEEDYVHHLQYIDENPKKWENDEYF